MVKVTEKIGQRIVVIRASGALKVPERGGGPFGAIEICRHVDFLSVRRPPHRGLDGSGLSRAVRGQSGFAGNRNATKSAAGNFVCVMGGRPIDPASAARLYDLPKIEALGWRQLRGLGRVTAILG
jgi:hypothetical protein